MERYASVGPITCALQPIVSQASALEAVRVHRASRRDDVVGEIGKPHSFCTRVRIRLDVDISCARARASSAACVERENETVIRFTSPSGSRTRGRAIVTPKLHRCHYACGRSRGAASKAPVSPVASVGASAGASTTDNRASAAKPSFWPDASCDRRWARRRRDPHRSRWCLARWDRASRMRFRCPRRTRRSGMTPNRYEAAARIYEDAIARPPAP